MWVGSVAGGEPHGVSLRPPPLFIPHSVTWARQPVRVGSPRSGCGSRVQWVVEPIGGEINLTIVSVKTLVMNYSLDYFV
jgi:hypothetical protein